MHLVQKITTILLMIAIASVSSLPIVANQCFAQNEAGNDRNPNDKNQLNLDEIQRRISISGAEHRGERSLRIYLNAHEYASGVPYPITTIERSMVKIHFTNVASPPVEPKSLSVSGDHQGDIHRALFLAFNLDRTLTGRELSEVRSRVGEIVAELPSEYLTVASIAQDSARLIAETTPTQRDNTNRIDQILAALPAEGEGASISNILCVAAEKFHEWSISNFRPYDQKILIALSPSGKSDAADKIKAGNCLQSLTEQNVRVIQISFGGPEKNTTNLTNMAAFQEGNGYIHQLTSSLDIFPAVKNAISLLRNEYIVDVEAPEIAIEDQPLELEARVSYHDSVISSGNFNIGTIIPALSANILQNRLTQNQAITNGSDIIDEDAERKKVFVMISISILTLSGLLYAIYRFTRRRLRTTHCNTCDERVRKDHSNCPFRSKDVVARLVYLNSKRSGMTLPLKVGTNKFSVFGRSSLRLPMGQIKWFNHGILQIEATKIAYSPSNHGRDKINGWNVYETRLLGQGHIVQLGRHKFRLEIKPQLDPGAK